MEYIKIYLKSKNSDKIIEKIIDVNDASHYVNMGWSLEKPKEENKDTEKVVPKKEQKKENNQDV